MKQLEKIIVDPERIREHFKINVLDDLASTVQFVREYLYTPYVKQIKNVYGCTKTEARDLAGVVMVAFEKRPLSSFEKIQDHFYTGIQEEIKTGKYAWVKSKRTDYETIVERLRNCGFAETTIDKLADETKDLFIKDFSGNDRNHNAIENLDYVIGICISKHISESLSLKEKGLQLICRKTAPSFA